jgi:hypothetical protein
MKNAFEVTYQSGENPLKTFKWIEVNNFHFVVIYSILYLIFVSSFNRLQTEIKITTF